MQGNGTAVKGDSRKLKRLGRYLVDRKRVVVKYGYQGVCGELKGFSDSDWAGCRRTAKSTSGGTIMKRSHWIKSWSSTQKSVTLSLGKAESVVAVKMATELMGVCQLALDWGGAYQGQVYVDSSAALDMVGRRGCGKMRHVKVGMVRIQEKQEEGELDFRKVGGLENPADLMTKHVGAKIIDKMMSAMAQVFENGRAETGLTVT